MSNRTNLSKSYNYTVTAASDNSAYLWSGHGLEDAPNPTIYIRSDDDITITNASGGHVMNLSSDDVSWGVTESNGQIVLTSDANLLGEGSYTYVCSSHPAMNGKIKISNPVVNGDPEDGYGTGLLPGNNLGGARASVSVDQIRTKINEIITKGGVGGTPGTGGGSISVSRDAPPSPSDGDLWWDSDTASLYVYFADRDAWIQTNGAVGGSSTAVNVDAEFTANTAHMSGGGGWFCFDDSAANITATIHTNDTSSLSTGNGSGTGTDRAAVFTVPDSGFYQLNASIQLNVNTSTSISLLLHTGDTIPNGSPENLAAAGQVAGENQETLNFSGARYLNAGDKLYFEYTCSSANVPQLKGRLSIFKINAGGGGGGGGDASIEVSATAPDPAEDGDLWFNTTQAELYVYVDAESAWIQTNGGGGSGGTGPRAYVAFDGRHPSDLTGSITSSSNVSSIEDKGVGQYEVNLASSISNPLLVSSPIGHHRQNYNDIVWHETHAIALPYGPNGNGITGGLGATTTSKIWVECNQPQTGGSQDAPVHLLVF
jgi:hypothetical protein